MASFSRPSASCASPRLKRDTRLFLSRLRAARVACLPASTILRSPLTSPSAYVSNPESHQIYWGREALLRKQVSGLLFRLGNLVQGIFRDEADKSAFVQLRRIGAIGAARKMFGSQLDQVIVGNGAGEAALGTGRS